MTAAEQRQTERQHPRADEPQRLEAAAPRVRLRHRLVQRRHHGAPVLEGAHDHTGTRLHIRDLVHAVREMTTGDPNLED